MFDPKKRRTVISLITNGSSRRVAAQFVGVAPSTITRAAARDPEFAAQLAKAEKGAEIEALHYVRAAAKKERYWRAAAWLLERKNPQDFAPRPPTLFTGEEVFQLISRIIETFHDEIPDENCDRVLAKLDEMIEACRLEQTTPTFPDSPDPQPSFPSPVAPLQLTQHPSSELPELTTDPPAATPCNDDTSPTQH